MPENENKTLTPEQIAEQRQAAIDKAIEKVSLDANNASDTTTQAAINRQNLTDEQKSTLAVTNAIHNAYSPTITSMGNTITELENVRKNAKAQDETAQRRSRNMQTIAGISDSLASLANLIGVGQGGTNINMGTGALTPLQQKAEAARLERKADIKSIDDRLEQYKNQLLQMKMQKGAALAGYAQKKEEKASDRAYDAAKTKDAQAFQQRILALQQAHAAEEAAKGRAHESTENALTRTHQEKMNKEDNESRERVAQTNAATQGSKRKPEQFTLTDANGKEVVYSLPAETAEAILRDFDSSIKADLAADTTSGATSSAFRQAYESYMEVSQKRGLGLATDEQVKDARNALIEESPTLRKKIESYGSASRWSNWES
jgi:hypothetical protein